MMIVYLEPEDWVLPLRVFVLKGTGWTVVFIQVLCVVVRFDTERRRFA